MFILNNEAFQDATTENIGAFVTCWSEFYKFSATDNVTGEVISYLEEINPDGGLDAENIRKLLRWKDRRRFTHPQANGEQNNQVIQIIGNTQCFNDFRQGHIGCATFNEFVRDVFTYDNSAVFRAFLFHIARPTEYPIWDQHVKRVYDKLWPEIYPDAWSHYEAYRIRFGTLKCCLAIDDELGLENVRSAKKLTTP